jgi:hypothetical protein
MALGVCLCASAAEAQGHRGAPPGQQKPKGSDPQGGSAPADPASGVVLAPRVRSFGLWLDDATLAAPRSVWITTAATRWLAPAGDGVEAPALNIAAGLTPRTQLSFAISHSRASGPAPDDEVVSGLGNVYAGVKVQLRDPMFRAVGVSLAPTIEILSPDAVSAGMHRVNWIAPLSFEVGHGLTRAYGSVGYFSRGAAFASAALERHVSSRVALTGALLQSWSTSDGDDAEALGLSRSRTDVYGGVSAFLAPGFAVFASAGRTISRMEFDSSRFVFSGGIAMGFAVPKQRLPRPPR